MSDQTPIQRYSGQVLADQAGSCMVLKAFLKKQALHTSNLRAATSYAEAAAVVDAYLNALTDVHGHNGLLDQHAQQAEEIARLRDWLEAREQQCRDAAVLIERSESQVQALREALVSNLDMLMVDRLRAWARNIQSSGRGDITLWGSPAFVAAECARMADDIERAVKSVSPQTAEETQE